jgi:hypothetical protein
MVFFDGRPSTLETFVKNRIEDPGCLSRIQQQQQKRRGKNVYCHTFFCSYKYHKTENYFQYEKAKKMILTNSLRIYVLFTQTIVTRLSNIWVWDLGYGI